MTFKFLSKLSQDFSELLNDKGECNVIIEVGQKQNKKSFHAHSAILRYRSSYFNKELTNTIPSDDNNKIIIKQYISAQIFEILLKYIYGGIINTENMDTRTMYDLMILADKLEFKELSKKLENHLIESKAPWLKNERIRNLGTAQNPILPEKLEEWSDENKILDKRLWNDLKQHFILPDHPVEPIILPSRLVLKQELPERVNEPFSIVINEEHASMISSWIDEQTTSYSSRNNPYKFQLIRGSKDGLAPTTFWDICDGHANTIVVTKVKGTDEIIGGFNPLAWDKTNKSFIFSFKDGNLQNSILSRVKNENQALWYSDRKDLCGPYFGNLEFRLESGESNFTRNKQNQCLYSNSYEKSIRTTDD
ncbi:hypothetical protein Glove_217g11 [Diversispora epigaea]|uniref:BTB domain-containing protein n=1 Tax=Diversispora epigaea TaxID=1348612 RepID=A0A397IGL1_9GLOM|nr:hypothetical protein Glove_217g11 [Diversispora epigaea]